MTYRLILAPRIWRDQLPRLAVDGALGTARLNRCRVSTGTELVAQSVAVRNNGVTGHDFGSLDELLLDPDSGHVSHLVLVKGHLWGKKEVAIPVSDISFCDTKTVYLKIDKNAVHALPSVKVKR